MKRVISMLLVFTVLSCLFVATASAATSIPTTCPKPDCDASIKTVRYGEEYTVKVGQYTIGNSVYFVYETRQGFSVVCTNNHGSDDYLVLEVYDEFAYNIQE